MIEFCTIYHSIKDTTGFVRDRGSENANFNLEQDAVVEDALNNGWKIVSVEVNSFAVKDKIYTRRATTLYRDIAYLQQMDRINNAIEYQVKKEK